MKAAGTHWQKCNDAPPLVAWRDVELQTVAAAVDAALQGWRAGWGCKAPAACTCSTMQESIEALRVEPLGARDGRGAWMLGAAEGEDALAGVLFGSGAPRGPVAQDVARSCAADLRQCLREGLHLGSECMPGVSTDRWAGTVRVTFGWGDALLLNAACTRWVLERQDPGRAPAAKPAVLQGAVLALRDALADACFPLSVALGDCEIALGALQDLQLGDVLRVDHPLDVPAVVQDSAGRALFAGHLVRRQGRKAVELASVS